MIYKDEEFGPEDEPVFPLALDASSADLNSLKVKTCSGAVFYESTLFLPDPLPDTLAAWGAHSLLYVELP